jgi:folate-binding protein YgfZ
MHDKLQPEPGALFALPDLRVITFDGRDAAAFAQAQFMNDVGALQPGHWHWSGWLTPKGRVLALFALVKFSPERLWMLVPDADWNALAESLRRFVFRSKVAVAAGDNLHAAGTFGPGRSTGAAFVEQAGGIELDLGSPGVQRRLTVGPSPATEDAVAAAHWKLHDLEHGLPRLPADQFDRWTPQQLSLERLNGFSVKKGCYPGQEIVARTHFLGKAKRGLVLLESDAPVAAGAEVLTARGVVGGSVVAVAGAEGRHLALAVMPLERETATLAAGGTELRERPLLDGLAR